MDVGNPEVSRRYLRVAGHTSKTPSFTNPHKFIGDFSTTDHDKLRARERERPAEELRSRA